MSGVICSDCGELMRGLRGMNIHLAYYERTGKSHEPLPSRGSRGRPRQYDDIEHRRDRDKKFKRYHRRTVEAAA